MLRLANTAKMPFLTCRAIDAPETGFIRIATIKARSLAEGDRAQATFTLPPGREGAALALASSAVWPWASHAQWTDLRGTGCLSQGVRRMQVRTR